MSPSDPYPVLLLLRAHLEGRQRQGDTRLWLQAEAAEALREMVRMKPRPRAQSASVAVTAVAPLSIELPLSSPERVLPQQALPEVPQQALPEVPQRLVLPERVPVLLSLVEKMELLAKVRERAQEGREAQALGTLHDQLVFAAGSPMAEILLLGEAPGAEEERVGEPFVGPAGQLLTKVLKVMGLERSQVYLTNLCKYRPAMESGACNLRDPSPMEMASCLEFVKEEIAIIRPKVIVVLGGTAITGLLGVKTNIMNARGQFYEYEGIPVMATLHPAYLLRKEQEGAEVANAEKRKFWEDMLMVMERADLPVTKKQRAFFLPK